MENNILNDKELAGLFEKDANGVVPDSAVGKRLAYTFMLKSSGVKVKQNSFLGMFTWFFSWSHLPAKAALVSLILLVPLFKIPNVESPFLLPGQDTTYNAIPFHIDSSETSPFFADTCLTLKTINTTTKKAQNTNSNMSILKVSQQMLHSATHRNSISVGAPVSPFLSHRLISEKSVQADLHKLTLFESRQLT